MFECTRGPRKGARAWQDHFVEKLLDSRCPRQFKQSLKTPTIFYSAPFEIALDLHVDDGYVEGPTAHLLCVFGYLEEQIVMKLSPIIGAGCAFEHVGALRLITEAGMWVQPLGRYFEAVLEMMGMKDCKAATSPKLDKANEDGDSEPCDGPQLYRSAVCTLLYPARRRPDLQSVVRWMCKRLMNPDRKSWRQLVKTVRYIKGTQDLATFMLAEGSLIGITGYLDGDWASDEIDRKSVSGGYIMVGGCRVHSHSRTTCDHALSSGESEIMAMSELLKECKQLKYNLELCGCGSLPITLHTDADVARGFAHKRGVGKMKHLDVRHCWLQSQLEAGVFKVKRVDRIRNASDMLTHAPSSDELKRFLPMVGLFPLQCAAGSFKMLKTALKQGRSDHKIACAILASIVTGLNGSGNGTVIPETPAARIGVRYDIPISCEPLKWFWPIPLVLLLITLAFIFGIVLGMSLRRSREMEKTLAEEEKGPDRDQSPKGDTATTPVSIAASVEMRKRRPECMVIWLSKRGECFHIDERCKALKNCEGVTTRRRCSYCVQIAFDRSFISGTKLSAQFSLDERK